MKYKRFFIITMIISQMFFWFYIISLSNEQTPALSYTLFTCFITLLVVSFFLYFITLSKIVDNGRTEFQLQVLEQEKQHIAESKNISIEYALSIPEKIAIPQHELASIFFNLLDNAIEACEGTKIDNPFIILKTSFQGTTLSIQMINSKDRNIVFNKKTSKKNKDNHGLGLSIIENIVHAYRGHVTWSDHGETFESVIILEINE